MKIKEIIKKIGKKEAVLGTVFVFLLIIALWQFGVFKKNTAPEVPEAPAATQTRRLLDGVWVAPGFENPKIVGAMVENMIEAQPISGVSQASLVFEAITEANITRFLAYFILDEQELPEIGPVRSARPYFLDWAAEFNTLYAHVGSSPAAYELLRKKGVEGVQDLDQWYAPQYYFTKDGRRRPHNLYTSEKLLSEAYKSSVEQRFDAWKFKNDASPDLRGDVADISVVYDDPYGVRWLYDKSENHYKRLQWGGVHKDAQGQEIIAKNVAVAFQKMKVLDEIGRKEFITLGEGEALVFQDGRVVVGVWKKSALRERMRFYDAQGQEVEFNAGVTWVEIVPADYKVSY